MLEKIKPKWLEKKMCECGCGIEIKKYGSNRQLRRYIKGHQRTWLGKKRLDMVGNCWGQNKDYFKNNKFVGEKHNNWKGGRIGYWRTHILKRDDYTCRLCGFRDLEIMQVDHIIPCLGYKNRYLQTPDSDNLQTLCPNCHARKTIHEKK